MRLQKSLFPALILLLVAFSGCSEFNRAMKAKGEDSLNVKLQAAEKFYFSEEYEKALPLLEELLVLTRGTSVSERVSYLHAKSFYGYNDFLLAGYYLGNFVKTFPSSDYAEECAFLAAYCYYRNSPEHTLDQRDTQVAMEQLQLFLVRFPETDLRDSCNTLMDELRWKLEEKEWEGAKQYVHLRRYRSASEALRSFLATWPASKHREEAMYLMLKSQYELAANSVESKKIERFQDALTSYTNFADTYTESGYSKEVQMMLRQIELALGINQDESTTEQDG